MKRTIALVVFLSLLITIVLAGRCQASTDQLYDATCRVTSGNGAGTGCAIMMTDTHVFVLTAKHVLNGSDIKCVFWRAGHASEPMVARVYETANGSGNKDDAALLIIDRRSFGGNLPQVIPLAPPGVKPSPGDTIYTVGCANGSWATGVKGHYVKATSDGMFTFQPNPALGRSGSAILDYKGQYIIGILLGQNYNGNNGVATSADSIREGLRNLVSAKATARVSLAQYCPRGQQCSPQSDTLPGVYIGGQNDRLGISINRNGVRLGRGVYPSAPEPETPAQPPIDVGPRDFAPPPLPAAVAPALDLGAVGIVVGRLESRVEAIDGRLGVVEDTASQFTENQERLDQLAAIVEDLHGESAALTTRTQDAVDAATGAVDAAAGAVDAVAGAVDAATGAAASAQTAIDSANAATDGLEDKIQSATDTLIEKAKSGIFSAILAKLAGYGWWATGIGGFALFLGWRFVVQPFADKLDGEKDGRINLMGILETVKLRVDRLDGTIDWQYSHNPAVMAQAEAMRAAAAAAVAPGGVIPVPPVAGPVAPAPTPPTIPPTQ